MYFFFLAVLFWSEIDIESEATSKYSSIYSAIPAVGQIVEILQSSDSVPRQVLIESDSKFRQKEPEIVKDLFIVSEQHPRYTEGSVVILKDGSLLYSVTEFSSGPGDHASAQIIATRSEDGGHTWSERFVLQPNIGVLNVMSSTLRYVDDSKNTLGHFFLVKNSLDDLKGYLRLSTDQGKTFGDTILFTPSPGYNVVNNDRIQLLKSGRLIAPIAYTRDVGKENHFVSYCSFSDDGGRTWKESSSRIDYHDRGAMEPEIIEFNDGRLGMIFRTQSGHIGISYSNDMGVMWGSPSSWGVRAPESPSTCRRIPSTGDLLLIWNDNYVPGADHQGKRIPLTAAISSDEGKTWKHKRNLEQGADITAAYCSLTISSSRVYLTYTLRDEKTKLRSHRFRSLPIHWFYNNN